MARRPAGDKINVVDKCTKYALAVVDGKIDVCKHVKETCRQHLDLFDDCRRGLWKDLYRYNATSTANFFEIAKEAKHYKGNLSLVGTNYVPINFHYFWFGNVYGWQRYDEEAGRWVWKHNELLFTCPKKNTKTFIMALGALYDCAFVEPTGAAVFSFATKSEQAKLLFEDCCSFVSSSELYSESFFRVGHFLFAEGSERTSFIRPLGKDTKAQGADGKNPIAVYSDEGHADEHLKAMYDIFKRSFSARQRYHFILGSTVGYDKSLYFKEYYDVMAKIALGEEKDPRKFALMYTLDKGDEELYDLERIHKKANPAYGIAKLKKYFDEQMTDIKLQPSFLNNFLVKDLNIWCDNVEAWLDSDKLNASFKPLKIEDFAGKICHIGVDLARKGDLSAFSLYIPKQEGVKKTTIFAYFFISKDSLDARETDTKMPFKEWVKLGFIYTTSGASTNFKEIQAFLVHLIDSNNLNVQDIRFDPTFAGEMMDSLQSDNGFTVVEFKQNGRAYTDVIQKFEVELEAGNIDIAENPCLQWNFYNVEIKTFSDGRMMPVKNGSQQKKIDGAISTLEAFSPELERKEEIVSSEDAYLYAKGYLKENGKWINPI